MSQLTLLHGARQLLTLRGLPGARRGSALLDLGIIEDGSILLENGVIHSVGPTRRLENLKSVRTATVIDVSGSIIMPGMVDPDVNFTFGEAGLGFPVRNRRISAMQESGAALLRSCLQHGTLAAIVNVSAETGDPQADISLLRQVAKISGNPVDFVRNWKTNGQPANSGELAKSQATLETLAYRRLLDSVTVMCGHETPFSEAWHSAIQSTGLPVSLRWAGNDLNEIASAIASLRPVTLSCPSVLRGSDVEFLARGRAIGVFSPGTEVGQRTGSALREFIDAGGAIALSSGYHPADSPGFSMQMAISLAIVQGRLTPEEAISAATVNAAYAVGRGHLTGTLEVGKRADLLVMGVSHYRDIARQFGINHVATALRDGNVVYNRGRWKILASDTNPSRVRSQSVGRS